MSELSYITVSKFAEITGIPPSTVYYWCDQGILPYSIITRGIRKKARMINYSEFLRIMEAKAKQTNIIVKLPKIDAKKAIDAFQKRISAKVR